MKNPRNLLKAAVKEGRHQLGIWSSVPDPMVQEVLAGAGFDWVLIDCEHAPFEVRDVLPALQAIAQHPEVSGAVRPAANDPVLIKRLLDLGAQTLIIPYVESADEARAAVKAMRYGPDGVRGMAGMTRATRYGAVEGYSKSAAVELCLITQIESVQGVKNLEAIGAVDGVDAVFIGPSDLSASMGYPGEADHPEVRHAIDDILSRAKAAGIPCGLMDLSPDRAKTYIEMGSALTAVGVDLVLLVDAIKGLREKFSL